MENNDNYSKLTLESNASFHYISMDEHHQFMSQLEDELVSVCEQDSILRDTTDLLKCCANDNQLSQDISKLFDSKVAYTQGRTLKLKLTLFDGQSYDVFVAPNSDLSQFKSSIERSIGLQLRSNMKKSGMKQNIARKINWKHVWAKYDLWLDRTQRISLCDDVAMGNSVNLSDMITSIGKHSTLQFIPRSKAN